MQIDWSKRPENQAAARLSLKCHLAALDFLRGFTDPIVVERYEGLERAKRLRRVQLPIILNAYDALDSAETVTASRDEVPEDFLDSHEIDWGYISSAIHALKAVQAIEFESIGDNEDYFELKASNLITLYLESEDQPDLNYSRPLDVHRWSEHSEVNTFVDQIYDEHFGYGNQTIQKKHIKVVLLDLYVAWLDDPALNISFSRDVNAYKSRSRYNSLHISKKTIEVVDRLIEVGLLEQARGFVDRGTGIGRTSRIWPTEVLIEKFQEARFGPIDIGRHEGQECIVLRDVDAETGKNQDIEYEDTEQTNGMRELLRAYNTLLERTFIDIPTLEENFIDLGVDSRGNPSRLFVNQGDKFVRRIFNRGSWEKGGRFWGGWWQRCPKRWRRFDPENSKPGVFIDDKPTSELDYSGMHIVMLYAQVGVDYWTDIGGDTYTIDLPDLGFEPEQLRSICKGLVLVALNARDDASTFKAFRDNADTGSLEKSLKDNQLKPILDKLRETHAPIADKFATDQGIDLMRKDSNVTERIIKHFTDQQIPILTIHDSYIIWDGYEDELDRVMKEAFEAEMNVPGVQLKRENKTSSEILDEHFTRRAMDMRNPAFRTNLEFALDQRANPPRTERYNYCYEQFQEWLSDQ